MSAKIFQFRPRTTVRPTIKELFTDEVYKHYIQYLESGDVWRKEKRIETLYEGYPYQAPVINPIREDMVWYINDSKGFGSWVINESEEPIKENPDILFGWSPFVRYSTAPPHELLHLKDVELRSRIVWYVNPEGYGQYAVVQSNGCLWLPIPKPSEWEDHNKRLGILGN